VSFSVREERSSDSKLVDPIPVHKVAMPFGKFRWARRGTLSTREFLNDIALRAFCFGLALPLIFLRLGFSDSLLSFGEHARSLVYKLAIVWPALLPQYEAVRETLGEGHAASFAVLSGMLWTWPVLVSAIALVEYRKRRTEIAPAGQRELMILVVLVAAALLELFVSGVGLTSQLFRFRADSSGFFYFVHYILFIPTAFALTYVVFLPGSFLIDRAARSEKR
jgi:hypothetical protein